MRMAARNHEVFDKAIARLKLVGVDVGDVEAVVCALADEIEYYRARVDALTRHNILTSGYVLDYTHVSCEVYLQAALMDLNKSGYPIVSITQSGKKYTIFFRRPING